MLSWLKPKVRTPQNSHGLQAGSRLAVEVFLALPADAIMLPEAEAASPVT